MRPARPTDPAHTLPMPTHIDPHELLHLHDTAYRLLLRINTLAAADPTWLAPESLADLSHPRRCIAWLHSRRPHLPAELLPPPGAPDEATTLAHLAGLLSSFFDTSFDVHAEELDGQLVHTRVTRRHPKPRRKAVEAAVVQATRHQLSRDGVKRTNQQVSDLVTRPSLWNDALLVAYFWELERRALGKSKGKIAHLIWRTLPPETRTAMTAPMLMDARARLAAAAIPPPSP